jgi:predicted nucleic acid-binding protein
MASASVIADASPLIALGWVDQLGILPSLFGRIYAPPAVLTEVSRGESSLPAWVEVRTPQSPLNARVTDARLGPGESEALCLGLEFKDAWIILDDGAARSLARDLGLRVLGTAAVLVEAKRAGHLPQVRPILDALLARGFRLDRRVYERILNAAGEAGG